MSYAIIINRKCKRGVLNHAYKHNKRLNKTYSNKDIDFERSKYNYSITKDDCKEGFIAKVDKIIKDNNVFVDERCTNITGEYVITSDKEYFNKVGPVETRRYFEEAYNFVAQYNDLGEKYIISADVHMDETTPHMHLVYMPVVHCKDENNNDLERLSFSRYWKNKKSYKELQDAYYKYIKEKNFDLERGEGGHQHIEPALFKEITKYDKTKKLEKENNNLKTKNENIKNFYKCILDTTIKEYNIPKKELKDKIKNTYNQKLKVKKDNIIENEREAA